MKRWFVLLLSGLLLLSACGQIDPVTEAPASEKPAADTPVTAAPADTPVPDPPEMKKTYTQITQDEALKMMRRDDGHVVVDVRRFDEYADRHIPGALLIPNEDIETTPPAALPDMDQIILIYCRSGNRSKQASQKLADMGYTNVYEFGGIITWPGEIETGWPEQRAAREVWTAGDLPVSLRYDRMWAYSDGAETSDPAVIGEIVGAVRALTVVGPTDVHVDDYTDVLTFTFADGMTVRLEFEAQNWVTETDERIEVDGLAGLRSLLDDLLADRDEKAGP